jgi:hypothetical protein
MASVPRPPSFAFDAFDKRHLPVDEITAPYTTTNFVTEMLFGSSTSMDQVIVICPRTLYSQQQYVGPLTDYIAMQYDANETISGIIPTLQTVRSPIVDAPVLGTAINHLSVRARLHNMSVRLECLGTNTGLYPPGTAYIGKVPTIETGYFSAGGTEALKIKTAWADDSISVGYLRSIPAASLVEKPALLHASVAETISYKSWRDFSVPDTTMNLGSLPFSTALEPIVIYVPRAGAGDTVVNYRIAIAQQWCSRHPHNIMLRSTQKQHPATPPGVWNNAVGAVKNIGEHMLLRAGHAAGDILATRMRQYATAGAAAEIAPM